MEVRSQNISGCKRGSGSGLDPCHRNGNGVINKAQVFLSVLEYPWENLLISVIRSQSETLTLCTHRVIYFRSLFLIIFKVLSKSLKTKCVDLLQIL